MAGLRTLDRETGCDVDPHLATASTPLQPERQNSKPEPRFQNSKAETEVERMRKAEPAGRTLFQQLTRGDEP